MLKYVYIEITNKCNLKCSFCSDDNFEKREMTIDEFKYIVSQFAQYTNNIYLHVKGEPFMHKNMIDCIKIANDMNLNVYITTNGRLMDIKKFLIQKVFVKQFNISLHSLFDLEVEQIELEIKKIVRFIQEYQDIYPKTVFVLRLWLANNQVINKYHTIIREKIKECFGITEIVHNRIKKYVLILEDKEFTWPNLKNDYYNELGRCLGGKTHLAVLSNGNIAICCLDSRAESNLGNIYEQSIHDIMKSDKYINTIKYFQLNKKYLEICKHCTFSERFGE